MPEEKDYLSTDRALLRRFRRGENATLALVYRVYAPRVARFLRAGFGFGSRGGSYRFGGYQQAFELENALQEVFMRAFSQRARLSYDGLRPYAGFLCGIARNVVIDEFRRNAARFVRLSEISSQSVVSEPRANPEQELEERELSRLLESYRASLSTEQRAVYELRFTRQLSQEESAKKIGLTRIQLRRLEAKIKRGLLAHCRQHGYLSDRAALGNSSLLDRGNAVTEVEE